jgi:hypothetical protein
MPSFTFRKSSYSTPDHECVEVATNVPATTAIRDSKRPNGAILHFPPRSWRAFQAALTRRGEGGTA